MFEGVSIEIPKEDLGSSLDRVRGAVSEGWFERDTFWELQTARVNETFRALLDAGVPLQRVRVRPRTLEDLFLAMTGKDLRG
jgi:ABC-2 type transport system ATP-binding protein